MLFVPHHPIAVPGQSRIRRFEILTRAACRLTVPGCIALLVGCGGGSGAQGEQPADPGSGTADPGDVLSEPSVPSSAPLAAVAALRFDDSIDTEARIALFGIVDLVRDDRFPKPSVAVSASFHDGENQSVAALGARLIPMMDSCSLEQDSALSSVASTTRGAPSVTLDSAIAFGDSITLAVAFGASIDIPIRRDVGPPSYHSDGVLTTEATDNLSVTLPSSGAADEYVVSVDAVVPPRNFRIEPAGAASADVRFTWEAIGGINTVVQSDHAWIDLTTLEQTRLRCVMQDDGDFSLPESIRDVTVGRLDAGTSGTFTRVARVAHASDDRLVFVATHAESR